MRIVIIDDDPSTQDIVAKLKELLPEHHVWHCHNFGQALSCVKEAPVDIVLAYLEHSKDQAFESLRQLRCEPHGHWAYVILISENRTQLLERLFAYHLQAQDFIAKPFTVHELQLMLRSKVAYLEYQRSNQEVRKQKSGENTLYHLHPEQPILYSPRGQLSLSEMEYRLMQCFFNHPNEWLTLEYLIAEVWKDKEQAYLITSTNLRSLIYKVRLKIESAPSNPIFILQSRQLGYMFCPTGANATDKEI